MVPFILWRFVVRLNSSPWPAAVKRLRACRKCTALSLLILSADLPGIPWWNISVLEGGHELSCRSGGADFPARLLSARQRGEDFLSVRNLQIFNFSFLVSWCCWLCSAVTIKPVRVWHEAQQGQCSALNSFLLLLLYFQIMCKVFFHSAVWYLQQVSVGHAPKRTQT